MTDNVRNIVKTDERSNNSRVFGTDLADIVRDKHHNFTIDFFGQTTNDRHYISRVVSPELIQKPSLINDQFKQFNFSHLLTMGVSS